MGSHPGRTFDCRTSTVMRAMAVAAGVNGVFHQSWQCSDIIAVVGEKMLAMGWRQDMGKNGIAFVSHNVTQNIFVL